MSDDAAKTTDEFSTHVERASDRELVLRRTFRARPQIVFDAMTKAELIRKWWIPRSRGVELFECTTDPRVSSNHQLRADLPIITWVTLLACAKPMMSSAMRRPTAGIVSAWPPSASAKRSVSARRSRSSSLKRRERRVSILMAVQGACRRSYNRFV